jgi:hypothetical protein
LTGSTNLMAMPLVADSLAGRLGDKFVHGLVLHDHDRITPFDEKLHAGPVSLLW